MGEDDITTGLDKLREYVVATVAHDLAVRHIVIEYSDIEAAFNIVISDTIRLLRSDSNKHIDHPKAYLVHGVYNKILDGYFCPSPMRVKLV